MPPPPRVRLGAHRRSMSSTRRRTDRSSRDQLQISARSTGHSLRDVREAVEDPRSDAASRTRTDGSSDQDDPSRSVGTSGMLSTVLDLLPPLRERPPSSLLS